VGALAAARAFNRAAVRYRIIAAAFVLAAAVAPVALALAAHRDAPAPGPAAGSGGLLALLALPALTLAATVAAVFLFDLAFDVVKLRRVKRGAVPLGTLPVRGARLGTSRVVGTPTAIGYVHPAVVLPENFRTRVDEREWDAVVAHECAHLARRDDWAKAVQSAVLRLGWWLPGLWLLGRALDLERELASDERAACETGPRRYAACLLRLATDREPGALVTAFGGRRSHVAIRVERLLRPAPVHAPVLRAAALGAFTAAAISILTAAVLFVPGTAPRHTGATPPSHRVALHGPRRAHIAQAHVRRLGTAPAPHRTVAAQPAAETVALAASAEASVAGDVTASGNAHEPAPRPASAAAPRRVPGRRAAALRPAPVAMPADTLALLPPAQRCRTCFGPLRSADDATTQGAAAPSSVPPGAAVALGPDDATGPASPSARMIWFRLPTYTVMMP
jgi:Zn-dependent protease with chaperone function